MKWIAAGGFSYSIGTVCLLWDALHFNHAVWHLFVMVRDNDNDIIVVAAVVTVAAVVIAIILRLNINFF